MKLTSFNVTRTETVICGELKCLSCPGVKTTFFGMRVQCSIFGNPRLTRENGLPLRCFDCLKAEPSKGDEN